MYVPEFWNVLGFFFVETEQALFSSENFWKIDTVALSFVFDKYCPIMD